MLCHSIDQASIAVAATVAILINLSVARRGSEVLEMRRRMNPARFTLGSLAVILFSLSTGCSGDKQPTFDLTPVSGTVMLDGKPLADADVAFYLQGQDPKGYYGSAGKTDAQGKYELKAGMAKGAVPGSYKVTVRCFRDANGGPLVEQEGMDLEQLKLTGQAKDTVPPKYSDLEKTELKATVEKGKADGYDFPL